MSDKKNIERYIDHARYALYSLFMISLILLILLWNYHKLLANGTSVTIGIAMCAVSAFGNMALNKISKQISFGGESEIDRTTPIKGKI